MYLIQESFQSQKTPFEDEVEILVNTQYDSFQKHMRKATALSHKVENQKSAGADQKDYREDAIKLQQLLNNDVYPIIATLRALQQKYEDAATQSRNHFNENQDLWTTTSEMETTNKRIQSERQRFDSTKALSAQSIGVYRHQNNIMWLNVVLFVLLVAGAAYMYYYVYSMNSTEHSLMNLPDNPKELFDNDYVGIDDILPQEKPLDDEHAEEHEEDYEEEEEEEDESQEDK